MATVSSSLALQDRFTATINKAIQSSNRLLKVMEQIDQKDLDVSLQQQFGTALQAEKANNSELEKMVKNLNNAGNAADPLADAMSRVKGALLGAGAVYSAQRVLQLADSMTTTRARLDLVIEGMNEAGTTADQLQQRIMQSANRSRASYLDISALSFCERTARSLESRRMMESVSATAAEAWTSSCRKFSANSFLSTPSLS